VRHRSPSPSRVPPRTIEVAPLDRSTVTLPDQGARSAAAGAASSERERPAARAAGRSRESQPGCYLRRRAIPTDISAATAEARAAIVVGSGAEMSKSRTPNTGTTADGAMLVETNVGVTSLT
jgi:hypothetical protein